DLEASANFADALQLADAAEIDDVFRALDAVLEPVKAVETACEDPCIGAIAIEQAQCVRHGGRLKQLERRHDISDHGHLQSPDISATNRLNQCSTTKTRESRSARKKNISLGILRTFVDLRG